MLIGIVTFLLPSSFFMVRSQEDVLRVFERADMVLKKEHLAAWQVR